MKCIYKAKLLLFTVIMSVHMLTCIVIDVYAKEIVVSRYNTQVDMDGNFIATNVEALQIKSKSVVLMEVTSGKIIYEQNKDERLSPASITKIMTLILIFDALKEGKISLNDIVVTSAYAKSMGGSQVFLEEGEEQTVETMIKCIVIASGNDASVAMAEYLSGSETAFVQKMNERAESLGMSNTHFVDCCGLSDSDDHYTSACDVAIMSRELVYKYPEIHDYSTIWMENITHVTAQGSKEFCLSNTNKLIKQYSGANGLKTGSTSKAKYCLSATAERNGVKLIAVVMAAPDYKVRFSEATILLNYGFANCSIYKDDMSGEILENKVKMGKDEYVKCKCVGPFSYMASNDEKIADIKKDIVYIEDMEAPIAEGDTVGYVTYKLGDREIGRVDIVATEDIEKSSYFDYFVKFFDRILF